ncbi:hypothetical protein BDV59DRAFT_189720 [Aspergillus ambiguus]|uniref:uncharacterized protein n=1 Tax=Aspergillus ambiguus TaxID=176160 RepID=UPI003CCDA24F
MGPTCPLSTPVTLRKPASHHDVNPKGTLDRPSLPPLPSPSRPSRFLDPGESAWGRCLPLSPGYVRGRASVPSPRWASRSGSRTEVRVNAVDRVRPSSSIRSRPATSCGIILSQATAAMLAVNRCQSHQDSQSPSGESNAPIRGSLSIRASERGRWCPVLLHRACMQVKVHV